jgi:hypothetical protein
LVFSGKRAGNKIIQAMDMGGNIHISEAGFSGYSRKKRIRRYLFAAVLLIFVALCYFASAWDAKRIVTNINVSGTAFVAPSEITSLIGADALNKPKSIVSLDTIMTKLKSIPFIMSSTADIDASGNINISVTEYIPVASLVKPSGEMNFVGKDGKLLPYRLSGMATDVPILRNMYGSSSVIRKALSESLRIIDEISARDNKLLCRISEIIFHTETQSYSFIEADAGIEVNFGRCEHIPEKIEKLSFYFRNRHKFADTTKCLDLRWKNRIVTT